MFLGRAAQAGTVLVGVLLTAAIAGCGADNQGSTPPAPAEGSTNQPAAAPQQASSGKPAEGNAKPDEDSCKAADLSVGLGVKQGTDPDGNYTQYLEFTNKSGRTCTMEGYPGVSYVTGPNGAQVGEAAFRPGGSRAKVTLRKGQTTTALLTLAKVSNFDPAACQPQPVSGLRVIPPGDTESMYVQLHSLGGDAPKGCANAKLPNHQLQVQMIGS